MNSVETIRAPFFFKVGHNDLSAVHEIHIHRGPSSFHLPPEHCTITEKKNVVFIFYFHAIFFRYKDSQREYGHQVFLIAALSSATQHAMSEINTSNAYAFDSHSEMSDISNL